MAKPCSKVLELNAPEGTVTEPSIVTIVPRGKLRASAIDIFLGSGAPAAAGVAVPVTTSASSSAGNRNLRLFLWIMILLLKRCDTVGAERLRLRATSMVPVSLRVNEGYAFFPIFERRLGAMTTSPISPPRHRAK